MAQTSNRVGFVHFKTKENFDNKVANNEILDTSIVFVQDSKEIHAHGITYKSINWSVLSYSNGVYIYDINGKYTLPSEWDTSRNEEAVGVAILTDDCSFVVAKEDIGQKTWGGYGTDTASLTNYSQTEAAKDFAGVTNTRLIIEALGVGNAPAAEACASYSFLNGQTGYLGAAGEWKLARSYKDELNSALELIGGTKMAESYYWASTEVDSSSAWGLYFASSSTMNPGVKYGNRYVRAFLAI